MKYNQLDIRPNVKPTRVGRGIPLDEERQLDEEQRVRVLEKVVAFGLGLKAARCQFI